MRIARTGRYRNAGTDFLSAQAFGDIKASSRRPKWNKGNKLVQVNVTGTDRGNNYVYTVSFPPGEIVALLQAALDAACTNRSERSIASSSVAAIQELLGGLGEA